VPADRHLCLSVWVVGYSPTGYGLGYWKVVPGLLPNEEVIKPNIVFLKWQQLEIKFLTFMFAASSELLIWTLLTEFIPKVKAQRWHLNAFYNVSTESGSRLWGIAFGKGNGSENPHSVIVSLLWHNVIPSSMGCTHGGKTNWLLVALAV